MHLAEKKMSHIDPEFWFSLETGIDATMQCALEGLLEMLLWLRNTALNETAVKSRHLGNGTIVGIRYIRTSTLRWMDKPRAEINIYRCVGKQTLGESMQVTDTNFY